MTVQKIAKLANVSIATVSRVLNNTGSVKPETAEAVMRAVEKLNTRGTSVMVRRGPRRGARVKQGSSPTIAIVSIGFAHGPWFQMPVMAKVIAGITREARDQHLIVQIEEGKSPDELGATLHSRGVAGALTFLPAWTDPQMLRALAKYFPVVRVMGEATGAHGVDHICPNNLAVGSVAFDYLMAQGCRDVAFLTANPTWDFIQVRGFGFQASAANAGIRNARSFIVADESDIVSTRFGAGATVRPTLELLIDAFVKSSPRPAGLFIPRDEETAAVYPILSARGVMPGRDVTVVSCDNEELRLSAMYPRPASIELGTVEIGRWAVRRLLARLRHPHEPAVKIQPAPRLALAAEEAFPDESLIDQSSNPPSAG